MVMRSKNQSGFTMIEVLIAMVVFVIASVAILSSVQALFASDARNQARINDQAIAHDLSAMIDGNPSILGSLNGVTITRGAAVPSSITPLSSWWAAAQSKDLFIQTVTLATTPATCATNVPCTVTIGITSKPPFGSSVISRTYDIQEFF